MGKRKSPYSTRLDPDVATAVDRYGEDHGLTQSEAVRRLVERGLEAGDGPTTDDIEELKDMVRGLEADRDADGTDRTTVHAGQAGNVIDVAQFGILMVLLFLGIGLATGSL